MSFIHISIIVLTLAGVALGRYPVFRMNRATIALIGAALLIITGAISLEEAYGALDGNTLVLLFSMMVLNTNLKLAGFFRLMVMYVTQWARTPRQLLALVVAASGLLSAIFLNDTIVLMFTPLLIHITRTLKRNPLPYLIALMTAANIGSAATLTGNPQNMIIGMASGISYLHFFLRIAPSACFGLAVSYGIILLVYREEFSSGHFEEIPHHEVRILRPLLVKSCLSTAGMLFAFLLGVPVPAAALAAAALLLFTRRVKPEKVLGEIDFTLLVFFSGLFIVTGSIETTGMSDWLFRWLKPMAEKGAFFLSAVSVILSNLISNVPTVLLFRPFLSQFPDPESAWLTLALSTTFAGNMTLIGSVANLIVAESASRQGIRISFTEYLKAGLPITLISLVCGMFFLAP